MANVIDAISIQSLLTPLFCVHGKTIYGNFSYLVVLASSPKFSHILIQPDNNILASPEAGQCYSLRVALCFAAPKFLCRSGSQEDKKKDKTIILKIKK